MLQGEPALLIERSGVLIAVLELVSPRNKEHLGGGLAAYTST